MVQPTKSGNTDVVDNDWTHKLGIIHEVANSTLHNLWEPKPRWLWPGTKTKVKRWLQALGLQWIEYKEQFWQSDRKQDANTRYTCNIKIWSTGKCKNYFIGQDRNLEQFYELRWECEFSLLLRDTPISPKVGTNFADKQQSLSIIRSWTKAKELDKLFHLWVYVGIDTRKDNHTNISWSSAGTQLHW
jgi:hypothetical protein